MDEREPSRPPEEEAPKPTVPLPEDFPENARVVPVPSKSIEEQRRELEEEEGKGTIKKRHGGGLPNSTPIG